MIAHNFDNVLRMSGTDRRRAMLALGLASLTTTLTGSLGASAKQSAGKKARKKCNKQKKACREDITTFCAQFDEDAQTCVTLLIPCCASCKLSDAVLCTANAFSPTAMI